MFAVWPNSPDDVRTYPFIAPMIRLIFAAWLAVLLLGMQHETQVHEFRHDQARLADGRQTALHSSAPDGPCELCALLAGGSHAVPAVAKTFAPMVVLAERAVWQPAWIARGVPSFYNSRAPPASL